MTKIVMRSGLAVTQSSPTNATEWSDASWRVPITHTLIATVRLALAWPHRPKRHRGRNLRGSETTVLAVALLLAVTGTLVATIYLSGLLMQRIQHLQRYNEPRAQYSDVWKWQGQRSCANARMKISLEWGNEESSSAGVPMTHKTNFIAEFKRHSGGPWGIAWYIVSAMERSHPK